MEGRDRQVGCQRVAVRSKYFIKTQTRRRCTHTVQDRKNRGKNQFSNLFWDVFEQSGKDSDRIIPAFLYLKMRL